MFGFKMKLGLGNKVLLPEYGQKKVLIERSCQAWNEILSENSFIKNLCSREWSFLVWLCFEFGISFRTQLLKDDLFVNC